MRLLTTLLFAAVSLCAQVSIYGTIGGANSGYWSNEALTFGFGAGYTSKRITIGGEAWRSEVASLRTPYLSSDRRVESALGLIAMRTWHGLHVEGGGGVQRITDTQYGPLIIGQQKYSAPVGIAGTYYQVGSRLWMRAGYRRLFVRDDHDTGQVYTAVGFTF